jgi:predicted AAA+ superfamily ATPase
MSGELATLLTGRYIELQMLPLSFKEYCQGMENLGIDEPPKKLFNQYLTESSLPYAMQLQGNDKDIVEYLRGIYSSVLLKDVVARQRITDVMMLEDVIRFVFDNIGSLLSSAKVANTLTSSGRKIDSRTVEKYLQGLMDSLLIYQAKRFDIKGKQYLANLEKYYVADLGFRRLLLSKQGRDLGHLIENVVYLELLRRGNRVYVGQMTGGEVDFVVQNGSELAYYQVAATVMEESTLTRELASLQKINDNYPKILLTLDDIIVNPDYDGIKHINLIQWLLS